MHRTKILKGDAMALVEVHEVDGKYQGTIRVVQASGGSYSQFCRSTESLCDEPGTAFEQAKSLAIVILQGL